MGDDKQTERERETTGQPQIWEECSQARIVKNGRVVSQTTDPSAEKVDEADGVAAVTTIQQGKHVSG